VGCQQLALSFLLFIGCALVGSSFANVDELEALLLGAGPARPMTAERKARIYGDLKP